VCHYTCLDGEHFFMYLLVICTSFENHLFKSITQLLIGLLFCCLIFEVFKIYSGY
jgi:hypothetical protein